MNSEDDRTSGKRNRVAELGVCAMLLGGTIAYLVAFPRNLGGADEGIFLYEAKRLLDGDVFYRDIFDIITPGSHYLMALAFRVFGTSMLTARITTAFVHGLVVALIYAACRRVRVRIGIAVVTALAYVALCVPTWPYASPHWISTCLTSVLLLVALNADEMRSRRGALKVGMLIGLIIMVQQQKGVILAPAGAALLGLHPLVDERFGAGDSPVLRVLLSQLVYMAAGIAIVVLPCFLWLIGSAGFAPVFRALVEHPLANYHQINPDTAWGSIGLLSAGLAGYTLPRLLAYLPAVLPLVFARIIWNWIGRKRPEETKALLTLLVLALFSIASILYHPDFIHVAFIAPIFFVAVAESLEWMLRELQAASQFTVLFGPAIVLLLVIGLSGWMYRNLSRATREYPVSYETAFGRLDFNNEKPVQLLKNIGRILAHAPSRELFSYPYYPALYLMSGTKNPTPYQILQPPYNQPDQIRRAIEIVEAHRVPLIFVFAPFVKKGDIFVAYMREKYTPSEQDPLLWTRKVG